MLVLCIYVAEDNGLVKNSLMRLAIGKELSVINLDKLVARVVNCVFNFITSKGLSETTVEYSRMMLHPRDLQIALMLAAKPNGKMNT